MEMDTKVTTTGLALPPVLGIQVGLYCDRSAGGFWPAGPWRDHWGKVLVLGVDAGPLRLRLVAERLRPGLTVERGLL